MPRPKKDAETSFADLNDASRQALAEDAQRSFEAGLQGIGNAGLQGIGVGQQALNPSAFTQMQAGQNALAQSMADIAGGGAVIFQENAIREMSPVRMVIVKILRGYWPFHWPWDPGEIRKKLPVGAVVELPEDEAVAISEADIGKLASRRDLDEYNRTRSGEVIPEDSGPAAPGRAVRTIHRG